MNFKRTEEDSFLESVSKNNITLVKSFLKDKKINPACSNNDALFIASKNGFFDIVKLLLSDSRIEPNLISLNIAVRENKINILKLYIEDNRIDLSSNNNQLLNDIFMRKTLAKKHTKYKNGEEQIKYDKMISIILQNENVYKSIVKKENKLNKHLQKYIRKQNLDNF